MDLGAALKLPQGLDRGLGHDHHIAGALKDGDAQVAHQGLVLDDQHHRRSPQDLGHAVQRQPGGGQGHREIDRALAQEHDLTLDEGDAQRVAEGGLGTHAIHGYGWLNLT